MNRKVERIIGWIGVGLTVLYMLLFLIGTFILFFIVAIMLFVRRSQAKREANKEYDRKHGYFEDITRDNENMNKNEKVNPEGKQVQDKAEHDKFDTEANHEAHYEENSDESELARQRRRDDHERPRRHDLDDFK